VVKPVAVKELAARLRAMRRRSAPTASAPAIAVGALEIRPQAGEVTLRGEPVAPTRPIPDCCAAG
jgi:DNA-binding response OmpR family regulator